MDTDVKLQCPDVTNKVRPTDADEAKNAKLHEFVSQYAAAGPPTSQLQAIRQLHELFEEWVAYYGGGFHMFLSGSYKMNVHTHDADIDVVFVTTNRVARSHVFGGFVDKLEACADVTDLTPIPNARVPIICITLGGQEFDIMTCHLRVADLPARDGMLKNYMWMNGLDEASILAFNGPRVTEVILAAVPRKRQFLAAVRFIRLWAKQRCIYSNKSGYLGGINIVLLTAYVSLRHPHANAAMLVDAVFATFSKWDWGPQKQVTFLRDGACPVWLRAYDLRADTRDAMVILTPCYPRFNTIHAASEYSAKVIIAEMARAHAMNTASYESICAPLPLAKTCQRFLKLSVSVPKTGGVSWHGFLESQVRYLLQYLSREELAIASFRFIPLWHAHDDASDSDMTVRDAYVTADDDRKIRSYAVKGNIHRAFDYFFNTHVRAGPPQPPGSSVTLEFVPTSAVPLESLLSHLQPFTQDGMDGGGADESGFVNIDLQTHAKQTAAARPSGPTRILGAISPPQKRAPFKCLGDITLALPPRPTRVVRIRKLDGKMVTPYDVYIGPEWKHGTWQLEPPVALSSAPRLSDFANDRSAWLHAYEAYITKRVQTDSKFKRFIHSLKGKVLACWCNAHMPCHGHVLAKLSNAMVV